ncbi:MAG: hypothetical protein C0592_11050 [Marinilabiliales bacterium]|nr:MAG: hypothetical protein C0592_11050 [Marinilabiliales bacterium]
MKKILIALLAVGFISFNAMADTDAKKPNKLLKKFATRVTNHDTKGILVLLDGAYKQVQLIGTLENDTTKFINELFCGYDLKNESNFVCFKLSEIKKCSFWKCGKFDNESNNPAYASATFKVENYAGVKIKVTLVVVKHTTSTGFLFRVAGAVG